MRPIYPKKVNFDIVIDPLDVVAICQKPSDGPKKRSINSIRWKIVRS